jgi:hypothetical protein
VYAVLIGLSHDFQNDHEQLRHGMVVCDALYAWCGHARGENHDWNPQTMPAIRPWPSPRISAPSSPWKRCREHLIDPRAIHVNNLQHESVPCRLLSGIGDVSELSQGQPRHCVHVREFRLHFG